MTDDGSPPSLALVCLPIRLLSVCFACVGQEWLESNTIVPTLGVLWVVFNYLPPARVLGGNAARVYAPARILHRLWLLDLLVRAGEGVAVARALLWGLEVSLSLHHHSFLATIVVGSLSGAGGVLFEAGEAHLRGHLQLHELMVRHGGGPRIVGAGAQAREGEWGMYGWRSLLFFFHLRTR